MKTSAPIGAWEVKLKIMTDQPTDQPTDRHDRRRERVIGKFHFQCNKNEMFAFTFKMPNIRTDENSIKNTI